MFRVNRPDNTDVLRALIEVPTAVQMWGKYESGEHCIFLEGGEWGKENWPGTKSHIWQR